MNWFKAFDFCKRQGGFLTEIESIEKEKDLESILPKNLLYWIGLADFAKEGHWIWQVAGHFILRYHIF